MKVPFYQLRVRFYNKVYNVLSIKRTKFRPNYRGYVFYGDNIYGEVREKFLISHGIDHGLINHLHLTTHNIIKSTYYKRYPKMTHVLAFDLQLPEVNYGPISGRAIYDIIKDDPDLDHTEYTLVDE